MKYLFESYSDFVDHQTVNEIGEGTGNVLQWKWDDYTQTRIDNDRIKDMFANFKADAGRYEVTIKPYKTGYYKIDFGLLDTMGNADYEVETNRGEMFKILATVVDISKEAIKLIEPKGLIITPSKSDSEDQRRMKLYLAYIKKQLPGAKVKVEGNKGKKNGKMFADEVIKVDL